MFSTITVPYSVIGRLDRITQRMCTVTVDVQRRKVKLQRRDSIRFRRRCLHVWNVQFRSSERQVYECVCETVVGFVEGTRMEGSEDILIRTHGYTSLHRHVHACIRDYVACNALHQLTYFSHSTSPNGFVFVSLLSCRHRRGMVLPHFSIAFLLTISTIFRSCFYAKYRWLTWILLYIDVFITK